MTQRTTRPFIILGLLGAAVLGSTAALAQTTTTSSPSTTTTTSPARTFSAEIARADLAATGIADPTDAQLSTRTADVQAMRDDGMGWGQIANSLGLRLGDVVSAANRADKATAQQTARAERASLARTSGSDGSNGKSGGKSGGNGKGGGGGAQGGLGGLVEQLTQGGLGDIVQSWISRGQNLPVSGQQLESALGPDVLGQLGGKLGVNGGQLGDLLAQALPGLVDRMTPNGQLPQAGQGPDLGALLGQLLR